MLQRFMNQGLSKSDTTPRLLAVQTLFTPKLQSHLPNLLAQFVYGKPRH
jgi:hypothetical protein